MVTMEPGANTPGKPRYAPSAFERSLQLLLIVVTFAVVGPVVGTIVIAVLVGLKNGTAYGLWQIPGSIMLGLFTGAAYVLGGMPAAVAGMLIGIKQAWFGSVGWLYALGTRALVGLGTEMYFHWPSITAGNTGMDGLLFVVATLSTLACWRIVTTWSFIREANP